MATITTSIQQLLKKTDRMKQQAVKGLLRTLKQIDQERKQRTADLDDAAKAVVSQLRELGHGGGGGNGRNRNGSATKGATRPTTTRTTSKMSTTGKKRRIRGGPEELKAEATQILAVIRKAGTKGIGGKEIRKSFLKVGPDIKGYVQKHGGGKLKTSGQWAAMRYHAA